MHEQSNFLSTMDETWRPVVGFEGRYEVSDQGRVRSLRNTRGWPRAQPLVLRPGVASHGYLMVNLGGKTCTVHRLVLEAFVGPRPPEHECAHLNGTRTDPRLANLRWVTRPENAHHSLLHGTRRSGERMGTAKLTEAQVQDIRRRLGARGSHTALAAEYGVARSTVDRIAWGRTWVRGAGEG